MAQNRPQQGDDAAGNQPGASGQPDTQPDPLIDLEKQDPTIHRARHGGGHEDTRASTPGQETTAKDIDTVRGHDTPQSVRHAG